MTTTTAGNSFVRNATIQQTGNFNINGSGIIGDSFGIGMTPNSGYKLDVNGNARFSIASGRKFPSVRPTARPE